MAKFSLHKNERLKSRKDMDRLFNEGNHFFHYPLRILWQKKVDEGDYHIQAGFTVSSRKYRKAVTRNRLKRKIRETYRYQKEHLEEFAANHQIKIQLMIIYAAAKEETMQNIESSLNKAIHHIQKELSRTE